MYKQIGILAGLIFVLSLSAAPARAAGDPAKGEKIFNRCKPCHSLEEGVNKIGPSLHGVFGRESGTLAGYSYSDAMKNAHITWGEDTLDKYLANPRGVVPGTKMVFPGIKNDDDRQDLIAYLKQATQ